MIVNQKWRQLGWRHPLWDYIRFYSVLQKQKKDIQEEWKAKLRKNLMEIDGKPSLNRAKVRILLRQEEGGAAPLRGSEEAHRTVEG